MQKETEGGGVTQTCAQHRPELLRPLLLRPCHHLLTFPAGALCQGFSIAIRRAHAALDNILISRVMGCVIQQPPIGSIKEWHPFIPRRVLPQKGARQKHKCCWPLGSRVRGWAAGLQHCFHTAQILASSLFILHQYNKRGRGACFSASS